MKYLIEILMKYCAATDISFIATDNKIDLYEIVETMDERQLNQIKSVLEGK